MKHLSELLDRKDEEIARLKNEIRVLKELDKIDSQFKGCHRCIGHGSTRG